MRLIFLLAAILLAPALIGCESAGRVRDPADGPERVAVDHILIGITHEKLEHVDRDEATARALAFRLLADLRAGASWVAVKAEHSDDRDDERGVGGPYTMVNFGVPPAHDKEYSRAKMVQAFGDVGFALAVDELGITEYSPEKSKYGFHIIKRLE